MPADAPALLGQLLAASAGRRARARTARMPSLPASTLTRAASTRPWSSVVRSTACSPLIGSGQPQRVGVGVARRRGSRCTPRRSRRRRGRPRAPAEPLRRRQVPGDRAAERHRVRDAVEHGPRDLLDEVDLARHVARTPGRDGHLPARRRPRTRAASRIVALLVLGATSSPISGSARSGPERDDRPLGKPVVDVHRPGQLGAGEIDEQPAREHRGRLGRVRVDALLPLVRALRAQASRSEVWRTPIGSKFAASSSTSVVASETSRLEPAHDRRERDGALAVGDQEVARQEPRFVPSSVRSVSPSCARRTTMRPPASFARSNAWSGLPQTCMT